MTSLYNINRKCSIIPVMMEREIECGFRTPMALNSIHNLKYFNNDTIYQVAMRRVLLLKSQYSSKIKWHRCQVIGEVIIHVVFYSYICNSM